METSQKNTNCFGNTQSRTFRGRCRTGLSASSQAFRPQNSSDAWTTVKAKKTSLPSSQVSKVNKMKNTNPKAKLCHFHFHPRKQCRRGGNCRFAHSRQEQEEAIQKFEDFKKRALKKAQIKDQKTASMKAAFVAQKAKSVAQKILKKISETQMAQLEGDIIHQPKKQNQQKKFIKKKYKKKDNKRKFTVGLPGRIDTLKADHKARNKKNWQEKEKLRKELGLKTMKWSRFNRWKRKQPKKVEEKKVEEKKTEKVTVQKIPSDKDFTVYSRFQICEIKKTNMTKWTEMVKKPKKEEPKKQEEEPKKEEKQEMKKCWENDNKNQQDQEDDDDFYFEEGDYDFNSDDEEEEEYEGTDAW